MLNRLIFALATLVALAGVSAAASAQERFALVLGNSNYQAVAALPNPVRDAKAVSAFLESAGFEVETALDLGRTDMLRAVRDFADKLADKGEDSVALVYAAGHGAQIDGENYLLPVDAKITAEADVALAAVRFADLMNMLDTVPSKTRIVILDVCRNNPFKEIGNTTARGLAIVNAPTGSIVAYSTSPGATAEDGKGDNSPFTAALVEAGKQPGAPIESVLQNVRLAVHKATDGRQTPWEVTALTEPFQFFPGKGVEAPKPAEEKTEAQWEQELQARSPQDALNLVLREDKVIVYQVFLRLFRVKPVSYRNDLRAILDRRLMMQAWFDAVTLNTAAAFEAFLKRYPDSDLTPTAKKLTERARARSLVANNLPGALDIAPTPQVKTVTREVIKEIRVPSPPEIRTVTKEVIKKVPVEVIKRVEVPVIKEVIKKVEVPVIKEVIKKVPVEVIKKVPVTVIKKVEVPVIKKVPVPARCPKQQPCR